MYIRGLGWGGGGEWVLVVVNDVTIYLKEVIITLI